METLSVTLRLDISSDRKEQQQDKTKGQLQARIVEDRIFDKFKLLRDGLHQVLCPEHKTTGSGTTFREGTYVKIGYGAGEMHGTIIDYTIHDCCCEKIADAAIEKFKFYKLKKV